MTQELRRVREAPRPYSERNNVLQDYQACGRYRDLHHLATHAVPVSHPTTYRHRAYIASQRRFDDTSPSIVPRHSTLLVPVSAPIAYLPSPLAWLLIIDPVIFSRSPWPWPRPLVVCADPLLDGGSACPFPSLMEAEAGRSLKALQ
jgi:hypothetical protein